jgi:drug/metabolite transporter (DMT)-like permease
MTNDAKPLIHGLLPICFVLLFSSGYVASKVGIMYAEPMTFQTIRLVVPSILLVAIVLVTKAPWPKRAMDVVHISVVGLFLHAVCFGGALFAFKLGVEAGVVALISGVHPLVVAVSAAYFLGERAKPSHLLGLLIGLLGVVVVVWYKLQAGIGTQAGFIAAVASLIGLSGSALYQKRFCGAMDLRTAALIQHVAGLLPVFVLAAWTEQFRVTWTASLVLSLAWASVVLSLGALMIFFTLIRHGAVYKTQAWFFLMPPAVLAWIFFGEQPTDLFLAGLALTIIGVSMINLSSIRAKAA